MDHHAFVLHETKFTLFADRVVTSVAEVFHWIWICLLAVIIANVVLRYVFSQGMIEFEELQWHLYAAGFLLAYGYAAVKDDHVRVDLLHARFSPRGKAWVDLLGSLLLLLPFAAFTAWSAWDFVAESWAMDESSSMPSGLPARWIIKFVLFFALSLVSVQALSTAARQLATLLGAPPESHDAADELKT